MISYLLPGPAYGLSSYEFCLMCCIVWGGCMGPMGELTGRELKARLTPKPSSPVVADLGNSLRGITRNVDSVGLSNSSSAFPDDFLRVKALGMKFGIVDGSECARRGVTTVQQQQRTRAEEMLGAQAAQMRIDRRGDSIR